MFYTSCDLYNNNILLRYNDGEQKKEKVKEFPIDLYVKDKTGSDISFTGEPLRKISFIEIEKAKNFIKEQTGVQQIYGQTGLIYQYLDYKFPDNMEIDSSKIKILFLDIETTMGKGFDKELNKEVECGLPDPDYPVVSITTLSFFTTNYSNEVVSFGYKPLSKPNDNYYQFESEEHMLESFVSLWRQMNPDFTSGFFADGFDIPYIIERINYLLGESYSNKLSPWYGVVKNCISKEIKTGKERAEYKILGIPHFDMLELYKKYSMNKPENYKLDTICIQELGIGKEDFSEYKNLQDLYEKNIDLYVKYNAVDVQRVLELEEKLQFISLALTIMLMGKIKPVDIFGQIKYWDNLIYITLKRRGIQIPPHKETDKADSIAGAFVKDVVPGLYEWIATFDVNSLYPSIICSYNLSPETLRRQSCYGQNDIDSLIQRKLKSPQSDVSILANGATFDITKRGLFAELVEDALKNRALFRKEAYSLSKQIEETNDQTVKKKLKTRESIANCKQHAFKIQNNSLYGAAACSYFRYFDTNISEGITLTGQYIIKTVMNRLNVFLNKVFKTENEDYVIFADTDSNAVTLHKLFSILKKEYKTKQEQIDLVDKFCKNFLETEIEKVFQELSSDMNCYENRLAMKREVIADKGLLRAKKNYVLQIWDKEGTRYQTPKLKMMGIETARSSTPKLVRTWLEEAIKIILNDDESTFQTFVASKKKEFIMSPLDAIAYPRGISDIDKYKDKTSRLPIHVNGSLTFNKLLKEYNIIDVEPIKNGDKIKFVYLVNKNPLHTHVFAWKELPEELFFIKTYVDYDVMFDKIFEIPISTLSSLVSWKTKKPTTRFKFT